MSCQKNLVSVLAFERLELPLDHTQPVIYLQGLLDPAKVGGLGLKKAVSLSFMVCSRCCVLMRALAKAFSMRV